MGIENSMVKVRDVVRVRTGDDYKQIKPEIQQERPIKPVAVPPAPQK